MSTKDDFDKIDTNKDGVISEEEYANAKKSSGIEKEKLNWFVRLITLGDRFDIKDFFDRFKKSIVEFIILVFGVTVSFGIEQQGGESDNRSDGIENLINLRDEIEKIILYTDDYTENLNMIAEYYNRQYEKWEQDDEYIFIDFQEDEDEPDGKYYFAPMSLYVNRNPFNPERVIFDAIKLDGTFRLLPKEVGLEMTKIYDGVELGYLIENTGKIEERLVNQFKDRIANKWVYDLPFVNIDIADFWVENRKYIQNDKFMKYILYQRLDLWEYQVFEQLENYKSKLIQSTIKLDSIIAVRESEYELIWWVLNPKD